jgi:hypothetical protein
LGVQQLPLLLLLLESLNLLQFLRQVAVQLGSSVGYSSSSTVNLRCEASLRLQQQRGLLLLLLVAGRLPHCICC